MFAWPSCHLNVSIVAVDRCVDHTYCISCCRHMPDICRVSTICMLPSLELWKGIRFISMLSNRIILVPFIIMLVKVVKLCQNYNNCSYPLLILQYFVFSSPEHKVLRVSYCDRSLSVVRRRPSCGVRRPSCVVRKLFYLNTFSSETAHWSLTKLHRNDHWVVPY